MIYNTELLTTTVHVGLQWGIVNSYKIEPSSVTCVNMVTDKKYKSLIHSQIFVYFEKKKLRMTKSYLYRKNPSISLLCFVIGPIWFITKVNYRCSHIYEYYYIMILFKQFYWLSCCHLTFRKI